MTWLWCTGFLRWQVQTQVGPSGDWKTVWQPCSKWEPFSNFKVKPGKEKPGQQMDRDGLSLLTLLHSERPKLHTILAFLSAVGLNAVPEMQ